LLSGGSSVPWPTSIPIASGAQYEQVSAQLQWPDGSISCQVTVNGATATGQAVGDYNIASAQVSVALVRAILGRSVRSSRRSKGNAMSSTESTTETTGEVPVQPAAAPPVYVKEKRVIQFSMGMLAGTIAVVLALGFLGGLAAQALFPAKQGPAGHIGKQGVAGPIGATGSAANINLSAEGLCFGTSSYSFNDSITPSLLTGAYLYTPTVTGNTKSCPTGSFVPLEPAPGASPAQ
jgi:hypothetical protein